MSRSIFLLLSLLVGVWIGAASVIAWANFSTPRSVTQLGGIFINSLKGENHA